MKKVLLISYFFPPHQVIGSQRPYKLAKYFPQYGWEPIVLTIKRPGTHKNGIRIIETDYNDIGNIIKSKIGFNSKKGFHEQLGIRVSKNFNYPTWKSKVIKLAEEVINYPDAQRGWNKFALQTASEFLFKEKVDAIISTSPPGTSHLIARHLKEKHEIPWVADFRDLWTQHHFYDKSFLIKCLEGRLELNTLSSADAFVTVTNRFADKLNKFHKRKKVFCVTNGYDTDDFKYIPAKLSSKFTITYTGHLYNGKMDPSLLFKVASRLINEKRVNKDLIEIRFYGPEEHWLKDDIRNHGLIGVVNYYGFISRAEAIERQKESQLLLLILDNSNKEIDYYPAKIFEYFGAGRPIITIGKQAGIVKDILENTNAGHFVNNAEILKKIILEYYHEFLDAGEIKCHKNGNIEDYTYNSITKRYSEILNKLVLN